MVTFFNGITAMSIFSDQHVIVIERFVVKQQYKITYVSFSRGFSLFIASCSTLCFAKSHNESSIYVAHTAAREHKTRQTDWYIIVNVSIVITIYLTVNLCEILLEKHHIFLVTVAQARDQLVSRSSY